jgi:hypothetical protein
MARFRVYPDPKLQITDPTTGLPIPADGVEVGEFDLFFVRLLEERAVSRTPFGQPDAKPRRMKALSPPPPNGSPEE